MTQSDSKEGVITHPKALFHPDFTCRVPPEQFEKENAHLNGWMSAGARFCKAQILLQNLIFDFETCPDYQGLATPRLNWDGRGHGAPVLGVEELDGYNGSLGPHPSHHPHQG